MGDELELRRQRRWEAQSFRATDLIANPVRYIDGGGDDGASSTMPLRRRGSGA